MLTANDGARELAVLGSPIAHSKSPDLHAAAYLALGLPWTYGRAEVTSEALAEFVGSRPEAWRGLSLTMPLKQAVLPLVSQLDATARLTGAANTILFDEDQAGRRVLRGFNTDVAGIVRAVAAAGTSSASSVVIWGGGATASSATVAAAELGAQEAIVQVREPSRAAHLVDLGRAVGLRMDIRTFDDEVDERPDLVISTLPGAAVTDGLSRRILAGEGIRRAAAGGVLLLDVAYDPWPTAIVAEWTSLASQSAEDVNVLSGLAMLVHQALLQVRIFVTGDPEREVPDEPAVLAAMLASVGLDASGRPLHACQN
jgi:shikimate dehydrogenase